MTCDIIYSYLMGVQAIDQTIFPEVLGKTEMFYCPRPTEKLVDLLPVLTLNNCLIT